MAPQLDSIEVSIVGYTITMAAVGGCAPSIDQLSADLVVGITRNHSMKRDMFTYTLIGMDFLELLAIAAILIAAMLLRSE